MKCLRLILMALTLTLTSGQDDWDRNCGSRCDCKWFSGKKMAECSGLKLTHVPTDLSSEIQILDLTDNRIPHLPDRAFSHANLVNLHKIVLRDCAIESVSAEAFDSLGIVIEVDLSGNKIGRIAPGTFVQTQRLRILRFDDNDLEFLENHLFKDLLYLQKIVLSRNRLVRIGERAFSNLPGLQTLALNGNNLTTLSLGTFHYLPKLSSLDLQENPWNCDCHLKLFHGWTLERRLYTRPTMCDQPVNLAGRMWDDVASEDFDCRPKIHVSPGVNLDQPGGDARLWCRTIGLPRPQLAWIRGSMVLKNSTKRPHSQDRAYVITETPEWLNLTIPNTSTDDGGDYACVATSSGGSVEKNVVLTFASDIDDGAMAMSFPLALGLGTTLLLTLLIVVGVLVWCRRRGRTLDQDKSSADGSPDRHGLGERGNSSVAAVNPGKLATPHGSLGSVLNGTLAGSESVFVDGPRIPARTVEESGFGIDDLVERGTLERGPSRRHLPPDLLAFRNGPESPVTHGFHPAPLQSPGDRGEPGRFRDQNADSGFPAGFRTLPHNRSFGPMTSHYNSGLGVMLRHGYVTIPRRPRPPSWGNGTGQNPNGPMADGPYGPEPLYDNLGQRTTADGSSVLSLNKSPEPSMRGRPLPRTPTGNPVYNAVQRSNPNILTSSPLDRSAPEGAPGWPARLPDEISQRIVGNVDCRTLGRKLPPRPPPKPENRTPPGPLFEDEGEDGTEV